MDDIIRIYRQARADYASREEDIFDPDPDKVRLVKQIVARLPQADRTLIIMYAECGSYRRMGKALGLSHVTIGKEILRIRAAVREEYERLKGKEL